MFVLSHYSSSLSLKNQLSPHPLLVTKLNKLVPHECLSEGTARSSDLTSRNSPRAVFRMRPNPHLWLETRHFLL